MHTSLIQHAFSAGLIAISIYMIGESTITESELTDCLWLSEDSSLDCVKYKQSYKPIDRIIVQTI